MQKLILAYNFTPERTQALKLACIMLRVQLRSVSREEMLQPMGYLAGLPDFAANEESYTGDDAREEMLIMCGLNRPELDRLLSAIKKGKLKQVALKAMLTPTNAAWNAVELQAELAKEHEYMTKKHGNASLGNKHMK